MKYWLEKTYPSKRATEDFTSVLLSPIKNSSGSDIYSNMREVLPNDIVFHLNQDTNMIVGYSKAIDSYDIIEFNETIWYTINLSNFQHFEPFINIDRFLLNQEYQDVLTQVKRTENKEVFYQWRDDKYSLKQGGYLTPLDERIIELFERYLDTNILQIVVNNEQALYSEGSIQYGIHKRKERSKKLIRAAKTQFKQENNGKLFCEVCKFDFVKQYGEYGENFIEAHHSLPVCQLSEDHQSSIEDIVLLCSNCHSMIHRKKEWLSVEELRNLLL